MTRSKPESAVLEMGTAILQVNYELQFTIRFTRRLPRAQALGALCELQRRYQTTTRRQGHEGALRSLLAIVPNAPREMGRQQVSCPAIDSLDY